MDNGGIVPGPVVPIEPGREYLLPLPSAQSAEYRERVKAIWAEALARWEADHG